MGFFKKKTISDKELGAVNKIIEECRVHSDKANSAIEPKEFFDEYRLLMEGFERLIPFEKYGIFGKKKPSLDLKRTKKTKQNQVNLFIRRSYIDAKQRAEGLDDEKRKEVFEKYFNKMKKYFSQMNGFNKKVILDLENMSK